MWTILTSILTIILCFGVILLYSGLTRFKFAYSTILHSSYFFLIGFTLFSLVGYGLVYNPELLLLNNLTETLQQLDDVIYQSSFCAISLLIVMGANLEKSKLSFNILFSLFWILLVYIPVAYMAWNPNGLFYKLGLLDYAGGLVVHTCAGFSALILAKVTGRRDAYFKLRRKNNNQLIAMGTFLIFIGWIGFNGGVTPYTTNTGLIILNTIFAAAIGAMTWNLIEYLHPPKRISVLGLSTGMITGLVIITPAAPYIGPLKTMIFVCLITIIANYSSRLLHKLFKIDDVADSFSGHGVGGLLATALTPLIISQDLISKDLAANMSLYANLISCLTTITYVMAVTYIIIFLLQRMMKDKLCQNTIEKGSDLHLHGEQVVNFE